MDIHQVSKTSDESLIFTLDLTNGLSSGITVASAALTSTKRSDGTTDVTIFDDTTPTTTTTTVPIAVTGGTSGETYRIKCTITGSGSFTIKVVYVDLRVLDP